MGVGRALRATMPEVRVVAVEPAESDVMSGGAAGKHGIQGIGDGFIPELIDMDFVDDVVAVGTAAAAAESQRIRYEHGYCVGMSAGANSVAARRLRDAGLTVATVWPDCSDRYVSLGLAAPDAAAGSCPERSRCAARWEQVIGGHGGSRRS